MVFPIRHRLYTDIIEVLQAASDKDEQTALQFASMIKSLANVQKNALGMIKGLARNGVVSRKLGEEAAFREWVGADPERRNTYGTILDEILTMDRMASTTLQKEQVLQLLGGNLSRFFGTLVAACDEAAAQEGADGAPLSQRAQALLSSRTASRNLSDVQLPILEILLDEARNLPEDQQLEGTEMFVEADPEVPTMAILEEMLEQTEMLDSDARIALFSRGADAIAESDDPFVVLARGIAEERREWLARGDAQRGRQLVIGPRWIEAQQKWRGKTFYPDANSTLRVSIASVKAYEPNDGILHTPHTTVAGILDKETGSTPFASPSRLLDAAAKRSDSRFFDAQIGDVPVCFLSDGDTTGGNSGSPVINGRGELVGINFDRVFENVAGDYGWLPERSRNISVDIRYALWIMDQVMPAPHLLDELGV